MNNKSNRFINPETLHRPTGYTHIVETTGRRSIYISGQIALDSQGSLVGEDDMGAQAEQIFKNLEAALKAVGAGFEDIVKVTYYAVDVSRFQVVREVRDRYFNPARPPASTLLEISSLARAEFLLEIEAIAVLD